MFQVCKKWTVLRVGQPKRLTKRNIIATTHKRWLSMFVLNSLQWHLIPRFKRDDCLYVEDIAHLPASSGIVKGQTMSTLWISWPDYHRIGHAYHTGGFVARFTSQVLIDLGPFFFHLRLVKRWQLTRLSVKVIRGFRCEPVVSGLWDPVPASINIRLFPLSRDNTHKHAHTQAWNMKKA